MAGHSRPKDGFRSVYVPAIHVLAIVKKGVDSRVKPGHDEWMEPPHKRNKKAPVETGA
jgi:hypothetical protein